MARFYTELDEKLQAFISEQKIFFTATVPREGRINLSPKGLDAFRCLDSKTVAFLNLTGSGNETAAHLLENGRITFMFCSFSKNPLILRIYGRGRSVHPGDEEWETLIAHFEAVPGVRQIVVADVDSVQTSCGSGVPLYNFQGERDSLLLSAERKGEAGMAEYREANNRVSIDGLPTGLPVIS